MFKSLPENIKLILNSTIPLVVTLILFVAVGQFGFGKISAVRDQISKDQKDQNVLNQKLNLLNTLGTTAQTSIGPVSNALPGTNPALVTLSQVKILAAQNGVSVSNVKGSAEVKDSTGLSRVDITFDVIGVRPQIFAFLNGISQIAPITVLDKVKMTESAGASRATISVRSFWSAFPTKLPPLNEPISDLTNDERNTLEKVANLTQPQFIELPPSESVGKTDPFTP